jgi:hypothetical protein
MLEIGLERIFFFSHFHVPYASHLSNTKKGEKEEETRQNVLGRKSLQMPQMVKKRIKNSFLLFLSLNSLYIIPRISMSESKCKAKKEMLLKVTEI